MYFHKIEKPENSKKVYVNSYNADTKKKYSRTSG